MQSFSHGVMLGFSLIIAIGAQNIWVLSQSMAGANRLVIALVCMLCDAALIVLGVFGAKTLQQHVPMLVPLLTWAGVLMLSYLAWQAACRAYHGDSVLSLNASAVTSWPRTALTAMAISLLNPHVYLDTVVLLGSIGALQSTPWLFAVGACTASMLWFSTLTAAAPSLKRLLSSTRRWRLFDGVIALMLGSIAWQLATQA